MRKIISSFFLVLLFNNSFAQTQFQKDFDFYWKTVRDNYAYFNKQSIHWDTARIIYQSLVDTCTTRNGFIHVLELTLNELYNGHNFLNTNTAESNRLIPSGADLKVIYKNGKFIIDEVRENFNADLCGLRKGMQIVSYNDQQINECVKNFLPRATVGYDTKMYEYAANMLIAGTHSTKRKITVQLNGIISEYFPDRIPNKTEESYSEILGWKRLEKNVGYIKINNSLGKTELVNKFDSALDKLFDTDALILDLRETPGGGNTTVARAIMSKFVEKEMPYQKHLYIAEERETGIKRSTLELVSPRQRIYRKPLVVLVGYWTASMGEGMAIGFDAMKRATIIGTRMAGLLGEIFTFETPELEIPFSIACVQLQAVNGLPRENFLPTIQVNDQKESVKKAMTELSDKIK